MLSLGFLALVALGGARPSLAEPRPAATVTAPAGAHARPLTRAQARAYAQREQAAAPALKKFAGGQVYIAISTVGAIVIAVVLILIFL